MPFFILMNIKNNHILQSPGKIQISWEFAAGEYLAIRFNG